MMKKLICILLTAALLMSVLMSVMVFSASADIVPTGYGYEDNSEAPTEAPTEEEPEPTCEPAPEPTEAALPDPTEPKPTQPTTEPSSTEPTESLNAPSVKYRELIDGTMELYYYSDSSSEKIDLVIPDTYDGKAVTSIASDFLDESTREKIYSVTIPDSVTKIEPFAFRYCSVKTVSLGKGGCNSSRNILFLLRNCKHSYS